MAGGFRPNPVLAKPTTADGFSAAIEDLVEELAPTLFFEKYDDYASEQEYRFVARADKSYMYVNFGETLRAVVLGAEFPEPELTPLFFNVPSAARVFFAWVGGRASAKSQASTTPRSRSNTTTSMRSTRTGKSSLGGTPHLRNMRRLELAHDGPDLSVVEVLPRPRPRAEVGRRTCAAFAASAAQLDSRQGLQMTSDKALAHLRPALVALGFEIEGGKKAADKLRRPVLFGEQGREERAHEVDGFHPEQGIALEIEAGRGTQGNAIYRDLVQTSLLIDARYLALGVLIEYHHKSSGKAVVSTDYRKTVTVLDAIYASQRLKLPLDGVLLIGY
jgi:hypothetical protein